MVQSPLGGRLSLQSPYEVVRADEPSIHSVIVTSATRHPRSIHPIPIVSEQHGHKMRADERSSTEPNRKNAIRLFGEILRSDASLSSSVDRKYGIRVDDSEFPPQFVRKEGERP